MEPNYLQLFDSGELKTRVNRAYEQLKDCTLCPHHCHVDRTQDELGYCKTGSQIKVASFGPHFGEEKPLVGTSGSGTIFFSNCNLRCVYCQNYDTSHLGRGEQVTVQELAEIMIDLQNQGCHNINFVTPSHMIHALLAATLEACKLGLEIPLVYNSGGYDEVNSLKLLDDVISIYMPDLKYADEEVALKYSQIEDYFSIVKAAITEMHRQVGDLEIKNGIAQTGLLIRHLILPEKLAGTQEIMEFISQEISPTTYVNIMKQYYPAYKAEEFTKLSRSITAQEFKEALTAAKEAGLEKI
ncbi:radical SAM protein [Halanaerobaculum tunisiense]